MKTLLTFLAACLIASVMVSPALVIWRIWDYHTAFVDAQHDVQQNVQQDSVMPGRAIVPVQSSDSSISTAQFQQQPVLPTTDTPAFLSFIVSIPVGFYSGRLLNHYQTRRSRSFRQQIATLERIWQQSIH